RLSWKLIHYHLKGKRTNGKGMKRTLIVGAGKGGTLLIRQMLTNKKMGMHPVVIVDDNPILKNMEVDGGVKVEGTRHDIEQLVHKYAIQKVVVAIPSLSKTEMRKIHDIANIDGVEVMTMPSIEDVLSGRLEVNMLKRVEVEDLLGREPVDLDIAGIKGQVNDKTILVTGAGGSIWSEIVWQIAKFVTQTVLLLGHCEHSISSLLVEDIANNTSDHNYIMMI